MSAVQFWSQGDFIEIDPTLQGEGTLVMIFYNNHHQEICTYALAHTDSTSLCILYDVKEVFAMQQIILFIRDCTYDFAHNGSNKSVYIWCSKVFTSVVPATDATIPVNTPPAIAKRIEDG